MERRSSVAPYFFWGLMTILTAGVDRTHGQGGQSDAKDVQGRFTPQLDHCTLDVEGHTVKAVRTHTAKLHEHVAGHLRITIDGSTVVAYKGGEEKPLWTANAPGAIKLVWLAADEKVIYLSGYKVEKITEMVYDWRPESPLRVRRLELDSGKWLDALSIGERPSPGKSESILGLRTKDGRVVVLTGMTEDTWDRIKKQYSYDVRDWTTQLISYRVSCFKTDGAGHVWSNLWSKAFSSAAKVERSVAVPLLDEGESITSPGVQPLTYVGEDILVCAGPFQDLLCLEGGTGKQRWRVERIWEFERRITGPFMTFRRSPSVPPGAPDEANGNKDEKRQPYANPSAAPRHCIVGGPVVVEVPQGRGGEPSQQILVAVARWPRTEMGRYLADCVLYQLSSQGHLLAMAHLPRMIQSQRYQVQKDGVVWACKRGAFVKVAVSPLDEGHLGLGFPPPPVQDELCRLAWYRHVAPEQPKTWLSTGPAGDILAFGKDTAFRVCAGGYVLQPDAGVYHFPLLMIDLKTGSDRKLVLRVPYKGKLPAPQENYSSMPSPQETWCIQTSGPHVLAITQLQVEGPHLRVTLSIDRFFTFDRLKKWAGSVDFPIDELQGRRR